MKRYYRLLLLFTPLLLVANSCEPDDPPDPEETIWNTPHQIERELFDFPLGSYWVMQNTLDTTQIDTFVRVMYSLDTTYRQVGNDLVIDVVLQVADTIKHKSPLTAFDYRRGISRYINLSQPGIDLLDADFIYSDDGIIVPFSQQTLWTEINYLGASRVRFNDSFHGSYLEMKRGIGLIGFSINDTLWTLIGHNHAN